MGFGAPSNTFPVGLGGEREGPSASEWGQMLPSEGQKADVSKVSKLGAHPRSGVPSPEVSPPSSLLSSLVKKGSCAQWKYRESRNGGTAILPAPVSPPRG